MTHVTYAWVMTYINETCHISVSHITFQRCVSAMTAAVAWRDSSQCDVHRLTFIVWRSSFDVDRFYVIRLTGSFVLVRVGYDCVHIIYRYIHVYVYVLVLPHSSVVCCAVTWPVHVRRISLTCAATWSCAFRWVMPRMNESCHVWMGHVKYGWVMSRMDESCHVWMSHVTYLVDVWRDWIMCAGASSLSLSLSLSSTSAHSDRYKWEMHFSPELMVQIKQKGVYGVENPL